MAGHGTDSRVRITTLRTLLHRVRAWFPVATFLFVLGLVPPTALTGQAISGIVV